MDSNEISQLLDDLAVLQDRVTQLQRQQIADVNSVIPAEVRKKMDDIRGVYGQQMAPLMSKIGSLEELIVKETLHLKTTVKGKRLKAVFRKGPVSWDPKKLMALSQTVYQVLNCRKQGKDTVRILDS